MFLEGAPEVVAGIEVLAASVRLVEIGAEALSVVRVSTCVGVVIDEEEAEMVATPIVSLRC